MRSIQVFGHFQNAKALAEGLIQGFLCAFGMKSLKIDPVDLRQIVGSELRYPSPILEYLGDHFSWRLIPFEFEQHEGAKCINR
jgi:hypothetical protein